MNMKNWFQNLLAAEAKPALPILSFPCISLLGVSVKELINDPDLQARGMKAVADRCPAAAAVSMMDLSVEAEAFGAQVLLQEGEVPTIIGALVQNEAGAAALTVPPVGTARTGLYVQAIEKAAALITDRPVLAGMIGPFSLAGRLMDVNEAMFKCYDEPETVHTVLQKATDFLIEYARAYRAAGADGILMAEPLAGILSPDLAAEFSAPYVKQIIDAVQTDDFAVVYHNCGGAALHQIESILTVGAMAYHFGNSISVAEMLRRVPSDVIIMGNVDPASQFRNGTPDSVQAETKRIMSECCAHKNFVISSGCDIPPLSPWENIDAFFRAVEEFYGNR